MLSYGSEEEDSAADLDLTKVVKKSESVISRGKETDTSMNFGEEDMRQHKDTFD